MSSACTLTENNSGVDSVTGTRDNITEPAPKTTPFPEECLGQLGMPQPDTGPLQIDETNRNPEGEENQKQQPQYEVVRSSEEANDTMPVPTLRPSSSSSASSSTSSNSSPSTTPSSVSPSSSKSLGTSAPFDHPDVVVEETADEEHTFAMGIEQRNDVTTSHLASFHLPKDVETDTAQTSASSSTSSLPKVTFRVPTSPSVVNIQDTGLDHESYGLLSLLRPHPDSSHNLSVRFAPLPELAPRRRKSAIPLGMAARSQLARKRRIYQDAHEDQDPNRQRLYVRTDAPPEGRSCEVDSVEMRMLKKRVLDKLRKQEEEEELEEDSLVVLAKKMGSAGKHLWKKMVAQRAGREDISSLNERQAAPSGVTAEKPAPRTVDPVTLPTLLKEEEEKVEPLDEKPQVRKRNKLQFCNPQAPTLSTP